LIVEVVEYFSKGPVPSLTKECFSCIKDLLYIFIYCNLLRRRIPLFDIRFSSRIIIGYKKFGENVCTCIRFSAPIRKRLKQPPKMDVKPKTIRPNLLKGANRKNKGKPIAIIYVCLYVAEETSTELCTLLCPMRFPLSSQYFLPCSTSLQECRFCSWIQWRPF